jgi:HD-GYP domain-containing protein (c-di-GMP phosphodiesterase class II)
MENIEDLTDNINSFLKENNLQLIDEIPSDYDSLLRITLKYLWAERNYLKRENNKNILKNYFIKHFEQEKLNKLILDQIIELDKILPPLIEINELYENILNEFNIFYNLFVEKNELDINSLQIIIKKILLIINKDKNQIISRFISINDKYVYLVSHSVNSAIISLIGGLELGFNEEQIYELGIAGLLHDFGMVKIPPEILNKTEKLTEEEFEIIKTHPVVIYKLLIEKKGINQNILDGIIQHHEKFNGFGYPKRLGGDKINIYAKIISISDSFESQISIRNYRKSKNGYAAMKEVLIESENKYDPKIMEVFLKSLSIYPPGSIVQLNNNSIGIVTSTNPKIPLKPVLKMIIDEYGDKSSNNVIKDLSQEPNYYIMRVINKDEYRKK